MHGVIAAVATLLFVTACATVHTPTKPGADRGYYEATIDYWMPEAQRGNPLAIYNLGLMSEAGAGMPQDREQALRFFTLAARMGLPAARLELARRGAPVPKADPSRRFTANDLASAMSMRQQQLPEYRMIAPPLRAPIQTNCHPAGSDKYCATYSF